MTKDIETIKLRGNDPTKTTRSIWDGEFVDILSKYRSLEDGKTEADNSKQMDIQAVKADGGGVPIKSAEPDIPPLAEDMPKSVLNAMEALRRLKSSQLSNQSEQLIGDDIEKPIIAETEVETGDDTQEKQTKVDKSSYYERDAEKSDISDDGRAVNQESIDKVKQRYMVGKIVGEDIYDSRGGVIVKRHELITMDIIDKVEKAGKIVDLVVNMQFPD